jgi:hypothetical protein
MENKRFNFKYITATPFDDCNIGHIMNTMLHIRKNGEIQICLGDTVGSDEHSNPCDMTKSAYPNQAELLLNRQALWLSMFTRHMKKDDFIEIEVEIEEEEEEERGGKIEEN